MSTNRNSASAAATEVQVARESVDDALMIVASYGPWGADLNDAHRRQIVLADEVHRLRHLYEMAVHGRAEMRAALRQERDGIDRVIELERLLADERERTQQLRGEAAVLAGLLRDCDLELAAIEAEDYRKGGEWVFLRAAIDIALNPINREGSLL